MKRIEKLRKMIELFNAMSEGGYNFSNELLERIDRLYYDMADELASPPQNRIDSKMV